MTPPMDVEKVSNAVRAWIALKDWPWIEGTDALLVRDLEVRCLHRVGSRVCPWHVLTGPFSDKRCETIPLGEYRARLILRDGPRPDLGVIIEF
jgi:hypothetical protein